MCLRLGSPAGILLGDACSADISTGCYREWEQMCLHIPFRRLHPQLQADAADMHLLMCWLLTPPGMNDIFREIGMRKSLFGQDLDVSPQRPESREFVV